MMQTLTARSGSPHFAGATSKKNINSKSFAVAASAAGALCG